MKRTTAWIAALVFLVGSLVYFNSPVNHDADSTLWDDIQVDQPHSEVPPELIGHEVGKYAPDFSAPVYGADAPFVLSEHQGKMVVVNFWATWCTPCCSELPYFDAIHRQYGEQVSVVAVHSDLITDDVKAYLAKFDYQMPFAQDETGGIIAQFGGSTMLPHTVILDAEGKIVYNAVGSLTYEELVGLLNLEANATPEN